MQAASHLDGNTTLATEFPRTGFGNAIKTACRIVANPAGVAVVRVTLSGFDTHANQPATQARLLGELADGLNALQAALVELGKWDDTLVLTYAEFGRRPKENQNNGTDHGTANVHFALGGRVTGGLYGEAPDLARLSTDGNPAYALRLPQRVRDGARALVGNRFARHAWRALRTGRLSWYLTRPRNAAFVQPTHIPLTPALSLRVRPLRRRTGAIRCA